MSLNRKELHANLYFAGLMLLAAAIPLSHFAMSLAQMLLLVNWLAEGDLSIKFRNFFRNRAALAFSAIYLLHVAGLFYTTDFDYALKDLRTKVPILLLPLIISTSSPLSGRRWQGLILFYILTVVCGSLASTWLYFTTNFSNIRDIFPYISHIRFSLNVVMAIVFMTWLLHEPKPFFRIPKIVYLILIVGLTAFLFMAQSLTGLGILFILAVVSLGILLFRGIAFRNRLIYFLLFAGLLGGPLFLFYRQVQDSVKKEPTDFKALEPMTISGNTYFHDTSSGQYVNGYPIWIYICEKELRPAWNKRSPFQFDGKSSTGADVKDVLLRFMTSKGLRKDSVGLMSLTDKEISYIEKGCTDVRNINSNSLSIRMREILWEYHNYRVSHDASGFSLMLRLEYWKASLSLIRENPVMGVGTGDMNLAFQGYYEKTHSKLGQEWRYRSHNQYLSVMVGFGVVGLIIFLFALFYPPYISGQLKPGLFFFFFLIFLLSMLTEDTIETQAGVTFAVFFYTILLLSRPKNNYL